MAMTIGGSDLNTDMDTRINRVFDNIYNVGNAKGFARPKIATMTISFQLSKKRIIMDDVERLCAAFVRTNNSVRTYNKRREYRRFNNAITVVFNKKAIKVFTNGKLHITGCASCAHALECARHFISLMKWDNDISPTHIEWFKVHTFNTCIRVSDTRLDMENVKERLEKVDGVSVVYNKEHYGAMKVVKDFYSASTDKMHPVTVLTFSTGTMMYTGVHTPDEISAMFDIMAPVIKPVD